MADRLEELRAVQRLHPLLEWSVAEIERLRAERERFFKWANVHPIEQVAQMPLDVFAETRLVRVWEFNEKCEALEASRKREEGANRSIADAHSLAKRVAEECVGHDLWYVASRLEKMLTAALAAKEERASTKGV